MSEAPDHDQGSFTRGRVLVVDDDKPFASALQRRLHPHHDVEALSSGQEALSRIVAGERFDAIVSDLMMPKATGTDLYQWLAIAKPEQASRMIFATGGVFTLRASRFVREVKNPRLDKPFELASLPGIIEFTIRAA